MTRRLEMMSLATLTGASRNPKRHANEAISTSIGRFGYVEPIVLDERTGRLVAGHGRMQALRASKVAGQSPPQGVEVREGEWLVPVLRGWASRSDTEAHAYLVASNNLTTKGGWDNGELGALLKELAAQQALDGTGFAEADIEAVLKAAAGDANPGTAGLTDPDDVPDLPIDPTAILGDVYLLGRHRLMCGDSTKAADVDTLLDGAKPHLMVTDPPYGIEYDAAWRGEAKYADGSQLSSGKHRAVGTVLNDDKADWRDAWALFPGDACYIWHAGTKAHVVAQSLEATGFELRTQIVWGKSHFVIGRGHYHPHHEPCWYAVRKGKTGHWVGDRTQSTLWAIDKPRKSETDHSTQKPVECMRRPITNNSNPGDSIYEPFSGSGTTIIAAEETGRTCYAMELNPTYVDVAVARWEAFTGLKAEKV